MAEVLSPKSFIFPHNIMHENTAPLSHQSSQRISLPSISSLLSDVDNRNGKPPALDLTRSSIGSSYGIQPLTPDRPAFGGARNSVLSTPPLPGAASFDFDRTSRPPLSPQGSYDARSPEMRLRDQALTIPRIADLPQWQASSRSSVSSRRASNESRSDRSDTRSSTSPRLGLAQQCPLPTNFPPALPSPAQQLAPLDPSRSPKYQYHHHYPTSTPVSYPQTTDRYQCSICQKAFSRPSSLKIHSYSHTGEKPFKCKYEGCGKYFSVRSNMKRHEKGCHGGDGSSSDGNSPQAC